MKKFSYMILAACLLATVFSQCPTFYTDSNQRGNSFQLCSSGNVPSQYNDQVSSFVVPRGYTVTLYQDYNNGGQRFGPYTAGVYNVPAELNDQLSSVVVSGGSNNGGNNGGNNDNQCALFYTDANLRGQSFNLCISGNVPTQYNVPSFFVNQVSSFIVPAGYIVTIYSEANQQGRSSGPYYAGVYNLANNFDNFDNQVRSITILNNGNSNTGYGGFGGDDGNNYNCPIFYTDFNQGGNSFQLCSSGNVPNQFNDQISSFVVPRGFTVTLYEDFNNGGRRVGPYRPGTYNVPNNFNDQLSSVVINRGQVQVPDQGQNNNACAVFYTGPNFTGQSFTLCASGNVPSVFSVPAAVNNRVSSFIIPAGYNVRLFSGPNQSGNSIGPYTGGFYNTPNRFAGRVSSIVIINNGRF